MVHVWIHHRVNDDPHGKTVANDSTDVAVVSEWNHVSDARVDAGSVRPGS